MRAYASISSFLKTSAHERARQVPVRALLAGVLSWALWAAGHAELIPCWLVASAAVQAFEFLAMAPFRAKAPRDLDRHRVMLPALAAIVLMSAVHAAIGTLVWISGDPIPVTVAILMIAGGLLTNVASGIESRSIFLIGAAPYLLALLALPVLMLTGGSAEHLGLLLVTICLFAMAVWGVWSRTHGAWMAETAAKAQAQARLEMAETAMADRAAMAAIVSHELRTPVSAILAGAHVIRTGGQPGQTALTAELIIDASRLMTGMLNDLLDHSKIQARAMSLEARDFDLAVLVGDTVRFWTAQAQEKGLAFTVAGLGDGPVWLRGDDHRLRQILNNLISNAIKFTQHGAVALEAACDPAGPGLARLRLTVRDQGAGIPAEAMAQLFAPFAQGSAETARTYGGTGLGLTVSRQLAQLMGGDLTADSPPGQGAAFTFEAVLPVGEPVTNDAEPASGLPDLHRRLRVLAADDHEINRRTLTLVLQPLDVELITVCDGASALALLEREAFDVVLMDVNMPGLNGNETVRRLRASGGRNAAVPVIGFSAGTEAAQVEACMAAGMTDWLAKPLEPLKLYAALERATNPDSRRAA